MRPEPTDAARDPFSTTRWSLILTSLEGTGNEAGREALGHLCRIYWRPIFSFVWRRSASPEDAQDLTQDFFLMILKGNLLERADPARGRFRSLLLKSLQNFLLDEHAKTRTRKRGGEVQFISWDDWMMEAPSQLAISAAAVENSTPETIYDLRWAATVAERALRALQEECEGRNRRRVFDVLSPALTAEREDVSYEKLSRELGVSAPEIKRLLHKLRLRYRQLLRAEVAETVEKPEDIDDELRYLVAALAAGMQQEAKSS